MNLSGEYELGNECFDKCIQLDPQEKEFYLNKAWSLYGIKNYEASLQYINIAINMNLSTNCRVHKDLFDLEAYCEKGIYIYI